MRKEKKSAAGYQDFIRCEAGGARAPRTGRAANLRITRKSMDNMKKLFERPPRSKIVLRDRGPPRKAVVDDVPAAWR